MLPPAMAITAPVECTQAVPSTFAMDPPWTLSGPPRSQPECGGIRGGEAENQSRVLAFNSAGHEDGSDEKESPLQIERGVQQVGRRSVDDAT